MQLDADQLTLLAILFAAIGGFMGFGFGLHTGYRQGVDDALDELRPAAPSAATTSELQKGGQHGE